MIEVWDKFIRAYHWQLPFLIIGLWISAEQQEFVIHQFIALWLLFLLLTRIFWGFCGSKYARFSHFIKSPKAIWAYLKNNEQGRYVGHTPLGALSVIALLLVLLVQIGSGLFAIDDIMFEGPLVQFIDYSLAESLAQWHLLNFNFVLGFIALHLLAVIYYQLFKKDPLIAAMLHGKKTSAESPPAKAHIGWLIGCVLLSSLCVAPLLYWANNLLY